MPTHGEKILAIEGFGALALRTADGFIRSSTLGKDRFSPQRFFGITITYGMLGLVASLGESAANLASAFGGLVFLATLVSSVPTGGGTTLGGEVAGQLRNLRPSS